MADTQNKNINEPEIRPGNSLKAKVLRYIIFGALVLGTVTLGVGLSMYTYSLFDRFVSEACGLADSTQALISNTIEFNILAESVMDKYERLTEEERAQTGTEEYNARFERIKANMDYIRLLDLLYRVQTNSDVNDIYVAVYDKNTSAIVYICDPDTDPETMTHPGDWEPLEERELNKFLEYDGDGLLYDIGDTKRYGFMCTAGSRLPTLNTDLYLYVLADVTFREVFREMRSFIFLFATSVILVIILLGWKMTKKMDKSLIQPINSIAAAAQKYVTDRKNGFSGSEHFSNLNIRTGDEVENLSYVMADMERGLSEYERDLTSAISERERIVTELTLAERIQNDMLPKNFDEINACREVKIAAVMDPAMEVGGDFYDFYYIDEDHLALTIADVSGKGIPAALFMMGSKIKLQDYLLSDCTVAEAIEMTNEAICAKNAGGMFVTVWAAVLELSTGKLRVVNAGHEYPALKKPDGSFELLKDKHCLAVGAMEGVPYKEYELTLEPGSRLFVYTDGVPEASNPEHVLFGTSRMIDALNASKDKDPDQLLKDVHRAVDAFADTEPQFDDLTMLCVDYAGPEKG